MERKKPENVVPQPFGKLFASYDFFNEMQNALIDDLLNSDKSLVLSAPTGSGKTVAFELAIVRMLQKTLSQGVQHNYGRVLPKAIYIAPIKALCSEKFTDWMPRFQSVGVTCTQLTGDTESSNMAAIWQAQIVISTPEKWDSLTRRWREFEQLLPAVQLFIVDEVHLLNEDMRGPILETVVARMKSSGVQRFVIASATIPNAEDLTSWLRDGGGAGVQVVQHVFDAMQRPVPLEKHVIGFNSKLRGFQFDMRLNYQLPDILRKYAEDKASLVFCNSRKSAEMAAFNLNKSSSVFFLNENQKLYLSQLAPSLADVKLRKLVENGIAYHHAGLQYADRGLIEKSFRQGFLMVLISTSTLAMGINLPAHLVVIKSTETYSCGSYTEYPENMILQMIGRAGRPQYDTKGVAVILTQQKNVQKYQKLLNGTAPIESHLHKHLTEHLNSEIALNTITSLEVAMVWMRSTYLYIRAVRNPKHYGFDAKLTKDFVEHKLEELCLRQINALQGAGLVKFDALTGTDVRTTVYGQLMTKYYICFETMKLFRQLEGKESLEDLLKLLVQCKEMSEFMLRVNEKKVLNELNKTPLRFPVKGRIKNIEEKISCIIQAVLGNIEISAPGLIQESLKIMRIGDRVSKCLLEYVRLRVREALGNGDTRNNWYGAMLNVVTLTKCLHVKLWENSEFATKQLQGIGTVYSNALAKFGITSLKLIAKTEARTIENLLKKSAPFGDSVLRHLMSFPEYKLKLERRNNCFAQVQVKQVNEGYVHKGGASVVLILGDNLNNLLLLEENLNDIISEYGAYERLVKLEQTNEVEHVYAHVIHVSLVGVDAYAVLEINKPKNVVKAGDVGGGKTKPTPKIKQSRLNFSFTDSFFGKTGLSDNSLNLDDILGNGFENDYGDQNKTVSNKSLHHNDSAKFFNNSEQISTTKENLDHSETLEDSFQLDKTATDLEDFRFKKPTMKSSFSKATFGEKTLDEILSEETFDETLSTTTISVKQSKLTDFFDKSKKVNRQVKNNEESIDLTSQKNLVPTTADNALKRKNVAFNDDLQIHEITASTLKQTKVSEETYSSTKEISPIPLFSANKENSKNNSSSLNSSSDDFPLTVIPNPDKTNLSNTTLNDSYTNVGFSKGKEFQSAAKPSPLSLASFLCDPAVLEKNERMIILPKDQIAIPKSKRSSIFDKSNEFKRNEQVKVNLIKPMQRPQILKQQIDLLSETLMRGFEESHLDEMKEENGNANLLEFYQPTRVDFDHSPQRIVKNNAHKKRKTFFDFVDTSVETEQKKNDDILSFTSKPNSSSFKVTAKYGPNNLRKRLNESSKSENYFRKLLLEESLLQKNQSNTPKTQYSPLDFSKTADYKKKPKLQATNFIKKENKATQTNFTEAIKQTPTENEFKLWHKVALQFSKVPLVEAQSLNNFQTVYNTVRQQQKVAAITKNRKENTTTNKASKTMCPVPLGGIDRNSSNLKVKQQSTFRLQLFENEKKAEECPKLNRREIKLINQNIMSLVLGKKCDESAKQSENCIQSQLEWDAEAELDKIERELGIKNSSNADWNFEPFF